MRLMVCKDVYVNCDLLLWLHSKSCREIPIRCSGTDDNVPTDVTRLNGSKWWFLGFHLLKPLDHRELHWDEKELIRTVIYHNLLTLHNVTLLSVNVYVNDYSNILWECLITPLLYLEVPILWERHALGCFAESCFIVVCERAVDGFGLQVYYMSQNTDPCKDKKTSHHFHTTSVGVWVGRWMCVCVCVFRDVCRRLCE